MNGERMTPTSAVIDIGSSVLANSAYLVPPVPDHGHRPEGPVRAAQRPRPGSSTSCAPAPRRYGIRLSFAEPSSVEMPAFAGTVSLRYSRPIASPVPAPSTIPGASPPRLTTMHVRRNQLTIAAVAFVLGLLVVVQLRAQAGTTGLAALSAQDLTVLVANLNERNDQFRQRSPRSSASSPR